MLFDMKERAERAHSASLDEKRRDEHAIAGFACITAR